MRDLVYCRSHRRRHRVFETYSGMLIADCRGQLYVVHPSAVTGKLLPMRGTAVRWAKRLKADMRLRSTSARLPSDE